MEVFLYNSTICRLCGEENDNGTLLYSCEENNQTLSEIVNTYLPIKVSDDGQLPRTICPGCTIQLEATVEFINLIIKGQKLLRDLHTRERVYKTNLFQDTSKEPGTITENIVYEINTTDGVYQVEHPIALKVGGVEKPKRKRGRPPKKPKSPEELAKEIAAKEKAAKKENEEPSGKRRRKTPTRFKEVVQGKELDRIYKEEGVIDGDESDNEVKPVAEVETKLPASKEPEVIGHMEESGELVMVVKGKGRGRPRGRMKQTREECAICGMEFSCLGRYMSHVAQHGPVLYQCGQCDATFNTKLTFNEHQKSTKHQGRNVIPYREQIPVDPEHLKTEIIQEVDSLNLTADLPSIDTFITTDMTPKSLPILDPPTEEIEISEQSNVITLDPLKVDEPPSEGAIAGISEQSEKLEPKAKRRLKCIYCDKTFSNKQSKSLHTKAQHSGERPYACSECDARFAYPRSLALHAIAHRRHKNGKGYACDLCGKVLNHPSSVVYHKEAEHAGQRYVCNKCGKSFKHKQLLQRHQLVHSQLRPYVCKTCDSAFKTKANLLNHQMLHSGIKKFSCEVCKRRFSHKTSLTLHMRWHNGHKPYSCSICGKSFSQKGNLAEHSRIHTGEKPYHCSLCPRRFTTSSQHRLHAIRHQPEQAYKCLHCPKRFATRATWLSHQRRESASLAGLAATNTNTNTNTNTSDGKRTFRCSLCSRTFATRWALSKHSRRHRASDGNKPTSKQISLLVDKNPAIAVEQLPPPVQERVIYVAYDVDDSSEPFQILDPEQTDALSPSSLPLLLPEADHMPVTDEQGNPLHFTMQDGTQLAITSVDGQSLQVVTEDGQTIPVEINGYAVDEEVESEETVVHQLNLQKTVETDGSSPVTHYFTIV